MDFVLCLGDVDGSVEAILDILETYDCSQCQLNLLSYGVGIVTEQDVEMAAIFKGSFYHRCFLELFSVKSVVCKVSVWSS